MTPAQLSEIITKRLALDVPNTPQSVFDREQTITSDPAVMAAFDAWREAETEVDRANHNQWLIKLSLCDDSAMVRANEAVRKAYDQSFKAQTDYWRARGDVIARLKL